jgi:hypothetical protein
MSKHLDIKWMAQRIATLAGVPDDRFNSFVKRACDPNGRTITVFGMRLDAIAADKLIRQMEEEKDDERMGDLV